LFILRVAAQGACRDCAQPGLGGPGENRFVAFDGLCRGAACRETGVPQVFVNASNLTLFVRVSDLAFGAVSGSAGSALLLDQAFNQDDAGNGPLGIGWSFSLGDQITADADGSLTLRRGTGRIDRFTSAVGSTVLFAVTSTKDSLVRAADGSYTLTTPGSSSGPVTSRGFSADGRLVTILDGANPRVSLEYDAAGHLSVAHYRGKLINFATDSNGRITSMKDAAGRSVSFTYNGDGRLTQQTNADGQTVAYQYDGAAT
jgi:YD repeat-containing protein